MRRQDVANIVLGIFSIGSGIVIFSLVVECPESFQNKYAYKFYDIRGSIYLPSMVIATILTVLYLIYVFVSRNVMKERRFLWAALLVLGNVLVVPFFWYFELWKRRKCT